MIEKGLITQAEFMQKLSAVRAGYQAMLREMRRNQMSEIVLRSLIDTLLDDRFRHLHSGRSEEDYSGKWRLNAVVLCHHARRGCCPPLTVC